LPFSFLPQAKKGAKKEVHTFLLKTKKKKKEVHTFLLKKNDTFFFENKKENKKIISIDLLYHKYIDTLYFDHTVLS
jgi:hypothetical protein